MRDVGGLYETYHEQTRFDVEVVSGKTTREWFRWWKGNYCSTARSLAKIELTEAHDILTTYGPMRGELPDVSARVGLGVVAGLEIVVCHLRTWSADGGGTLEGIRANESELPWWKGEGVAQKGDRDHVRSRRGGRAIPRQSRPERWCGLRRKGREDGGRNLVSFAWNAKGVEQYRECGAS